MDNSAMPPSIPVGSINNTRPVWRSHRTNVQSHLLNLNADKWQYWQSTCNRATQDFKRNPRVGSKTCPTHIWSVTHQQLSVLDLQQDMSACHWTNCPQQVPLVMTRNGTLMAHSIQKKINSNNKNILLMQLRQSIFGILQRWQVLH